MDKKTHIMSRLKWRLFLGFIIAVVIAANHIEYHFRSAKQNSHSGPVVNIRAEDNLLTGHSSIGIEESVTKDGSVHFLQFSLLGDWDCTRKNIPPCPPDIMKLNKTQADCIGFMYPLAPGAMVKSFCLTRSTQTCCYGPRPQFNQYLLVETKSPVRFERLVPVIVEGRFFVDPQPSEGYIYRIEADSVKPLAEEGPEETPEAASKRTGLPLFDFAILEASKNSKTLPEKLTRLDGSDILVSGFFAERREKPSPHFMICEKYWGGISKGEPPTLYNAVMAYPKDALMMPPVWKEKGIMKGKLYIEKNPSEWAHNGIVSLHNVENISLSRGISVNGGPFLGVWEELLLIVTFLWFALKKVNKNMEVPK